MTSQRLLPASNVSIVLSFGKVRLQASVPGFSLILPGVITTTHFIDEETKRIVSSRSHTVESRDHGDHHQLPSGWQIVGKGRSLQPLRAGPANCELCARTCTSGWRLSIRPWPASLAQMVSLSPDDNPWQWVLLTPRGN